MERQLETYQKIERSIIKKFRKQLWTPFIVAMGYSIFYVEVELPNGSTGQLLDIMDYISNSVMMPFIALLSTILIGWVVTPDYVISEMERSGDKFRRKKLYRVMIRFVAPVMMFILFLQSTGILS